MSGLVQRMEALAWVARRADPDDGRGQRVWLLPDGAAQLPALRKALARINERLTAGFGTAELHVVGRWLEHVKTLGDADD